MNVESPRKRPPPLVLLESVSCLECGEIYAKPTDGGTVQRNPGSLRCGYVGWLAVTLPQYGPRRYAAGRPPRRHVRRR